MTKNFKELSAQIDADPARRARVDAGKRAIRDALALAELRQTRGATQNQVAALLKQSQANVSRVERERDVYLSTLRAYVEALGGELELRAVFDDDSIIIGVGEPEHTLG